MPPDEVVPFDKERHLSSIEAWWRTYYPNEALPIACIPPTGAVALHRGRPGASCFVYATNAAFAVLALAVADAEIPPFRRIEVLRAAISGAIAMAKEIVGADGVVWSCTDNAIVARLYRELGMHCPGGTSADVFYLAPPTLNTGFLE